MKILFDTNVILDVLLDRKPWVEHASTLWQTHDEGRITGHVVASTLADIFYIVRRATDLNRAHDAVRICLETFEICTVDRGTLEQARNLPGNDFEDSIQITCAIRTGLDAIATRDPAGFTSSPILAFTPEALIAQLKG